MEIDSLDSGDGNWAKILLKFYNNQWEVEKSNGFFNSILTGKKAYRNSFQNILEDIRVKDNGEKNDTIFKKINQIHRKKESGKGCFVIHDFSIASKKISRIDYDFDADQEKLILSFSITDDEENHYPRVIYNNDEVFSNVLTNVGYWEKRLDSEEYYCSQRIFEIWELNVNERPTFEFFVHSIHPEDKNYLLQLRSQLLNKTIETLDHTYRIYTHSGKVKWIHEIANIRKSVIGKDEIVSGTIQEITDINALQKNEIQKSKYLKSMNAITATFLEEIDWENALKKSLSIAGNAIEVNRVYLYENFIDKNKKLKSRLLYEWYDSKKYSQFENDLFLEFNFDEYNNFYNCLSNNNLYEKRIDGIIESAEKKSLAFQSIKSILVLPIFIDGKFFGFIGFDDCRFSRNWSSHEKDFLKTFIKNFVIAYERKKHHEEFHNALAEKSTLLERIADGFFAVDPNWEVTYWNKSLEQMLQMPKEKIIGQNLWEVYSEARDTPFYKYYEKALKEKIIQRFEEYYEPLNKWFNISVFPTESGLSVYVKDDTERKQKESEIISNKEYTQSIINSIDGIVWEAEVSSLEFTFISHQIKRMLGFSAENFSKDLWIKSISDNDREKVLKIRNEKAQNREDHNIEYRISSSNGKVLWVHDSVSVIKENDKWFLRGIITDISERKRVELALEKSRLKNQNILDQSLDMICTIDIDHKFLEVSAACNNILGFSPEEMCNKNILDFVLKSDQENTLSTFNKVITGIELTDFQNKFVHKNGSVVHVSWSIKWNEKERIMYCVARDSTKYYHAKKQLQLSEQRFKGMVQEGADLIAILSAEGKYIYASPNCKAILGTKSEDYIGKIAFDFIHENDIEFILEAFEKLKNEKRVILPYYRFKDEQGDWRWLETTLTNLSDDPSIGGIVANSRDVSERVLKRNLEDVEKEVLQLSVQYESSLKNALDFYLKRIEQIYPDFTCAIMRVNDSQLLNWSSVSLPDEFLNVINGLKVDENEGSCGRCVAIKKEVIVEDISKSDYWDKYKDVAKKFNLKSCWSFPIKSAPGEVIATFSIYHRTIEKPSNNDLEFINKSVSLLQMIIERDNFQTELLVNNQKFELINKAINDAIWEYDVDHEKLYFGEGYSRLFGYNNSEKYIPFDEWSKNIHKDELDRVVKSLNDVIQDKNENFWFEEYRYLKKDQTYAYVLDKGFVVRDQNGKAIRMLGAMQDLSEIKKNEIRLKELNYSLEARSKELERSNKELEQFAFVASHDLQEPLRMVTGFLTQIQNKYKDQLDEKGEKYINFSIEGANKMKAIINDLMLYSRAGKFDKDLEVVELDKVMGDIQSLLRRKLNDLNATLDIEKMPVIKGYYGPIRQVFQNLISNSLKYSRNEVPPQIKVGYLEKKDEWEFFVQDNGIGIEEEYYDKIFVIFKRLHRYNEVAGTGMGLTVCKKIIENLGGKIWLESKYGEGSTFYFSIPKFEY